MKDMKPEDKRELARAYKDAADKISKLSERILAEEVRAEEEGQEPSEVQAITEVRADLVTAAMELITGDVPPDTADIIGVYRKSMARAKGLKVNVLSHQLIAVLDAAGAGK